MPAVGGQLESAEIGILLTHFLMSSQVSVFAAVVHEEHPAVSLSARLVCHQIQLFGQTLLRFGKTFFIVSRGRPDRVGLAWRYTSSLFLLFRRGRKSSGRMHVLFLNPERSPPGETFPLRRRANFSGQAGPALGGDRCCGAQSI